MRTLHAALKGDVAPLDKVFVRSELLSEHGVTKVSFMPDGNRLAIEYDPAVVDSATLMLIVRRYDVRLEPLADDSARVLDP
jgi:hypothetical protein